jgi:molybdopterin-guanine dinucleotide biosynthesis protein A
MRLAGLILAGGASSRMGRDKALLTVDGVTLLDRARALLCEAGAERIVVAGRPDVEGGLPDLAPGTGPARAARDALLALADAGLEIAVVVPVDMPLLTSEALDPLIAAASIGAAAYDWHPLPLCVRLHGPTIEAAQAESLRGLLEAMGGIRLPTEGMDESVLANVNTPEEWAALVQGRGT